MRNTYIGVTSAENTIIINASTKIIGFKDTCIRNAYIKKTNIPSFYARNHLVGNVSANRTYIWTSYI